jgi:MFS family permease
MGSAKSRPIGYICFILFLIFLILFVYIEKKVNEPIVSPKIFKNGGFVVINIIITLCSGFLIGINAYFPMWMQGVLGYSATISGMTLIPLSLTWAIGSHFSGKLLVKITAKRILQIGLLIMTFGGLCIFISRLHTPFYIFLIISAILGIGFGIVFTTTTVTVQQLVPSDMIGVATSFYTLAQTIGQTVMVTVFGLILNMHINNEILKYTKQGITKDMMNQLIHTSEAKYIPNEITELLKGILYGSLHNVYTAALILIIAAMLVNWFNHSRKLDV